MAGLQIAGAADSYTFAAASSTVVGRTAFDVGATTSTLPASCTAEDAATVRASGASAAASCSGSGQRATR